MNKISSKHMISSESLDSVYNYFSNHPRRVALDDPNYVENKRLPNLVDLKNWESFNDTVNIVFGDSHAEFLGRLFKEVTSSLGKDKAINRTYCFWTGASTLVGSLQSTSYFNNILRSLVIILEGLIKRFQFKKLNLVISLGEIDIRTKLFLESFSNKATIETIISKYCDERLVNKLKILRDSIENLYHPLETNVFFKSPPPPSESLIASNPKSNKELENLLEKEAYPAFLPIEERRKNHAFLLKSINRACLVSGVRFLKNSYSHFNSLDPNMSFDGVHVSMGEWAIENSKQIFLEI